MTGPSTAQYFRRMTRLSLTRLVLVLAIVAPFPFAPVASAKKITPTTCATYLGVRRCVTTREPAPKRPTTTTGMQAVASPSTIRSDGTVTFVAGGRPGGRGFTVGEIVRIFEFRNGKVSEMINAQFANAKGSIQIERELLSLPGVDNDGPRTLCARGERSLRMACDNYNVGTSTTTTTPAAITSGPRAAKTSAGMRARAGRSQLAPGQTTKITFSATPGRKGFKAGEKIVFYDFYNGGRETVDTGKAATNGSVTLTVGWRDGATFDGTHELCSYGVTSKMMACYTLTTVEFTAPDPGTTTTVPATTSTVPGPTSTTTTTQPYSPPAVI